MKTNTINTATETSGIALTDLINSPGLDPAVSGELTVHDEGELLIEEGEPLPPDTDTLETDREYAPDPCDTPDHDDWYDYLVSRMVDCDAPNDDDDWDGYSVVGIDASGIRIWG
jgi:hypothetical protein